MREREENGKAIAVQIVKAKLDSVQERSTNTRVHAKPVSLSLTCSTEHEHDCDLTRSNINIENDLKNNFKLRVREWSCFVRRLNGKAAGERDRTTRV